MSSRLPLVVALSLALAGPAWAGPFSLLRRNREAQPTAPAPVSTGSYVSDLILTLKTDADAGRRSAAAEELRNHDVRANPEIVPVLIEAAQRDARPEVRLSAVQSLGRIRPVSAEVGRVIEQVAASDSSMRVRLSARSTLWQYQLAGYRGGHAGQGPAPSTTQEPPLADPNAGPVLAPPADGPALEPPPPAYYQPPPAPPRVVPTPRRGPTSWQAPAPGPVLQEGTPLSSYRLISPVPPRAPVTTTTFAVEPMRHEEEAAPLPGPSPMKSLVPVPARQRLAAPQPASEPVEAGETGPMLNAPQ